MKAKTKILAIVIGAVVLITATVAGTLAFLTSRDSVVNEFSVGNVTIVVDEAKVKPDGTLDTTTTDRVDTNKYHLVPGNTYIKDPTVTVKAKSEESYVRMFVTINNLSDLKTIFGANFLPENYVQGWDRTVWVPTALVENGDEVTYEFRYFETVDASNSAADVVLPALFENFTLPGEVSGEELATINDLKITVVGNAIQASTFQNADEAWRAFDAQMN